MKQINIQINVTEQKYNELIDMDEDSLNRYVNNAFDVVDQIKNISVLKNNTSYMYKAIVESIHELTTTQINPKGNYLLKTITQKVADKLFNGIINDGLSTRISFQMKDLNLKTQTGTGNYRIFNAKEHEFILKELYKQYLNLEE